MQLKWLNDFLSLCDSRSFTIAAEERHLSPSAFGRRIRSLESWLGEELFDRSQHPVELTHAGNCLREQAQKFLDMAQDMKNEAGRKSNPDATQYVFSLAPGVHHSIFCHWIRQLGAELDRSKITLSISEDGVEKIADQLLKSKLDFYIAGDIGGKNAFSAHAGIESSVMAYDRLIPVCLPELIPVGCDGKLSGVVKAIPYISDIRETRLESRIAERLHQLGESGLPYRRFEISDMAYRKVLVLEGLGFSWLSYSAVEQEITSGTLTLLGGDADQIPSNVRIYYASENRKLTMNRFWQQVLDDGAR